MTGQPPARIVYCLDNLGIGGTELNAVRLAERLDRSRFQVSVACFRDDGALADRLRKSGIRVSAYPVGSVASVRGVRQLRAFARDLQRDHAALVHCHDRYSNAFGVLAARIAGIPAIASKRWGEELFRHRLTNAFAYRAAAAVWANSESVAASLEHDDRVARERIVTVPNFLDDEAFVPPSATLCATWRQELSLGASHQVVGIIASLRPVKQHALLLQAVARLVSRLPHVVLVLVGDGESRRELEVLAGQLGIAERVRFAGVRPSQPTMHGLFDVSVLCSRSEGSPNSMLEAMAIGRAVVGTDVPGIRDVVRDGETGLLVPDGDVAAMEGAIERLITDQAFAARLGARGRERVMAENSASRVVGDAEELYDRLVRRRVS